ncbi:MAG: cyclase family protein [Ruminiclostridium sp.]
MKIVDLTQGFYIGLKPYNAAWYPRFEMKAVMIPSTDTNGTTRTFTQHNIFCHNATHVESSLHFFPDGKPINEVDLEILVGPAIVADLSYKSVREPIYADDLEKAVGDIVNDGCRLLIRTDYLNNYWESDSYWDNPPYLTLDAVNWIVEKKIKLVGIDCLTEKPGDITSPVHFNLLKNDIPIIEYIKNMNQLSQKEVFLIALPILVKGAEAAAARVIAIDGKVTGV